MASTEDTVSRVRNLKAELSRSEQRIAQLLLKSPDLFIRESIRVIAGMAGVSEPTVIRFCRTVGFEGFKDLKFQLAQELTLRQSLSDAEIKSNTATSSTSARQEGVGGIGEQVWQSSNEALSRARDAFDSEALSRAAETIVAARRVMVYGIGGSSAILAEEMQNRLARLAIPSVSVIDSYMQRMTAATLSATDTALFISSTGRPRSLQDSLELANHYGARTIAIAPNDSQLGRDVDICLHVELSQYGVGEIQPNPMRYGQLYVVDCLAFAVAMSLGERSDLTLRRVRASVASLNGIATQQPLGD